MTIPHLKSYNFQPGQSGNPGGRIKLPPELLAITRLSAPECRRLISKFARMTVEEIEAIVADKKATGLDAWIASLFSKGIAKGDGATFALLLERSIGKVKLFEEDEDESKDEIGSLPDDVLFQRVREKLPEISYTKKAE